MKSINSKITLSDELLIMIFYLFMLLCGFAAGTQLWSAAELPAVALHESIPVHFTGILLILCIPAVFAAISAFLLAFFAAGWLLLPVFIYLLGGTVGMLVCSFFGAPVTITNFSVPFTVSACYLCTLAAACFIAMHAHRLSRQIACAGGSKCAYTYSCGNILLASVVIFISDIIFACIIYLQVSFA